MQMSTHIFPQIQVPVPDLPAQVLEPELGIVGNAVFLERLAFVRERQRLGGSSSFGDTTGRGSRQRETLAIGDKLDGSACHARSSLAG